MLGSHTLTGRRSFAQLRGNGDAVYMQPLPPQVFSNPAQVPTPLPAGATVSAVDLPSTWVEGALSPANLKKFYEVNALLQKNGVNVGSFDFVGAAGLVTTGLAMGGPVGAIVGAFVAVWQFLTNGTGHVPVPWQSSGPGVVAYAATLMPEPFSGTGGWMFANTPSALGSIDTMQRAFLAYTIDQWKFVLDPQERNYSGVANSTFFAQIPWAQWGQSPPAENVRDAIRAAGAGAQLPAWVADEYAKFGIDYAASLAERRAGNRGEGFAMLSRAVRVDGLTRGDVDGTPDETSGGGAGALLGLLALVPLLSKKLF